MRLCIEPYTFSLSPLKPRIIRLPLSCAGAYLRVMV
jgi:hypothetical protein